MSNTLHRQKVDLERTHEKLRDVVAQKSKLALDLSYHKSMLEGLKRDNQLLLNKLSESNENSTNA